MVAYSVVLMVVRSVPPQVVPKAVWLVVQRVGMWDANWVAQKA